MFDPLLTHPPPVLFGMSVVGAIVTSAQKQQLKQQA
jgi:hypothetical protein